MTTILVSGAVANKPLNGGNAWAVLSWVLGLRRLGFDVRLVEQIDRAACVDARGAPAAFADSVNLEYFRRVSERFGLQGAAALLHEGGESVYGTTYDGLLELAEDAALLVNITGHLTAEPLLRRLRRKAYVDFDPGYTQFWHVAGNPGSRLAGHDVYFTVGENVGRPGCPIPTGDIRWHPVRPPVVLDQWPAMTARGDGADFTTVASWRGAYGRVEYGGTTFGLKAHEFRKFVELPRHLEAAFEIALDIHPADAEDAALLQRHGWGIADPHAVAADPLDFQQYIRASGAEFSAAQGIYVETRSGWISDRTVKYLASGKPVVVQDTGVRAAYPVGEGLLTFESPAEALAGAQCVGRAYESHSRAARAVAEEYFDSDRVLARFVDVAGVAA